MPYVITGTCINDAACVEVCPVDCIHPAPKDAAFAGADMLFIDPVKCIDCNACLEACPVDAIRPAQKLPPHLARYAQINASLALARSA